MQFESKKNRLLVLLLKAIELIFIVPFTKTIENI